MKCLRCVWSQASQFNMEHFSGMHNWYACSHARPTFCNVCREALPGVTSHGLSCEGKHARIQPTAQAATQSNHAPAIMFSLSSLLLHQCSFCASFVLCYLSLSHSWCVTVCKFKAHKRCAVRSTNNCKWTTLASIGNDIIEDEDGVSLYLWIDVCVC